MEQQKITLDISDSTPIKCEECECEHFVEVYMIRKISKLLTGSSEDMMMPVKTFACKKCGHINDEFLPKTDKSSSLLK